MNTPAANSRETAKSLRTRTRILRAAMSQMALVGYHGADNACIAAAAGLTRGALLYHFPVREDLVLALIPYIEAERIALFEQAAVAPAGVDASEHAIDSYWKLLHETPFLAFAELEAAARADDMIRLALSDAQNRFDRAQLGGRFNALAQAGIDPRFQASRDLGRFLLEGLARGAMTYDQTRRADRLISVVKRAVRALNRKGEVLDLWMD